MEFKKALDPLTSMMADNRNSYISILNCCTINKLHEIMYPLYEIMNIRTKLTLDLVKKSADFFPKT